jgi:hypothetical protein
MSLLIYVLALLLNEPFVVTVDTSVKVTMELLETFHVLVVTMEISL